MANGAEGTLLVPSVCDSEPYSEPYSLDVDAHLNLWRCAWHNRSVCKITKAHTIRKRTSTPRTFWQRRLLLSRQLRKLRTVRNGAHG